MNAGNRRATAARTAAFLLVLAIGYPAETKDPDRHDADRRPLHEIVSGDVFSKPAEQAPDSDGRSLRQCRRMLG
jgi:hypothetical protein